MIWNTETLGTVAPAPTALLCFSCLCPFTAVTELQLVRILPFLMIPLLVSSNFQGEPEYLWQGSERCFCKPKLAASQQHLRAGFTGVPGAVAWDIPLTLKETGRESWAQEEEGSSHHLWKVCWHEGPSPRHKAQRAGWAMTLQRTW